MNAKKAKDIRRAAGHKKQETTKYEEVRERTAYDQQQGQTAQLKLSRDQTRFIVKTLKKLAART